MIEHPSAQASTTEGLPVSPSLGPALMAAEVPPHTSLVDYRNLYVCILSLGLGIIGALAAQALTFLIRLITNISFYGRFTAGFASPAGNHLGLFVILIPITGALIVGFMARYGSSAIRGHGIPEAMEQVLTNKSVIPARITLLKPLSAAVSIGTGGPFGAEGPIIASGGAIGSLLGQILHTRASERKTLLAAGAAAGMAATFGSPVSAVLLATELLLFEFRAASLIPVAIATTTAAGLRILFEGAEPVFAIPHLQSATGSALMLYALVGALIGVAAVGVTRAVYAIEDAFDHLPIHWMWWPAMGAIVVGVVGYFAPRTLGVGYDNIIAIISNQWTLSAIALLVVMKFISWSIALGSGTSGGTLAPLMTIGGGMGAILGTAVTSILPASGLDIRIAALVGMAAMFAGASRALLASIVFAFETTAEPAALLPLLAGCSMAYLISSMLMRQTIMTEKISRRGVRVPTDYSADILDQLSVASVATREVVHLSNHQNLGEVRAWVRSEAKGGQHQGFPVFDESHILTGVLTRRDLLNPAIPDTKTIRQMLHRPPVVVYADCSLRQAVDHMVRHDIGRLPVIDRKTPGKVVGFLTRSDIFTAYRREWEHRHHP